MATKKKTVTAKRARAQRRPEKAPPEPVKAKAKPGRRTVPREKVSAQILRRRAAALRKRRARAPKRRREPRTDRREGLLRGLGLKPRGPRMPWTLKVTYFGRGIDSELDTLIRVVVGDDGDGSDYGFDRQDRTLFFDLKRVTSDIERCVRWLLRIRGLKVKLIGVKEV